MGERYEIKNLNEAFKLVKDKDLEEVYLLFKKDFSKEITFSGIYTSLKEISLDIKDRIKSEFNDNYRELKTKISKLRKHGEEVSVVDFELLRVPLKMKLLDANFSKENYLIILSILKNVEKELSSFKIDY
ncbi:hypothetical protein GW932_04345 [archaeon]|nr:hypothetical protein [archaeon]